MYPAFITNQITQYFRIYFPDYHTVDFTVNRELIKQNAYLFKFMEMYVFMVHNMNIVESALPTLEKKTDLWCCFFGIQFCISFMLMETSAIS